MINDNQWYDWKPKVPTFTLVVQGQRANIHILDFVVWKANILIVLHACVAEYCIPCFVCFVIRGTGLFTREEQQYACQMVPDSARFFVFVLLSETKVLYMTSHDCLWNQDKNIARNCRMFPCG